MRPGREGQCRGTAEGLGQAGREPVPRRRERDHQRRFAACARHHGGAAHLHGRGAGRGAAPGRGPGRGHTPPRPGRRPRGGRPPPHGLDGCPAAADPGQEDFDSDGAGDVCDDDDDDDGLLDTVETETGSYGSPTDTGTHPRNPDSDGDGFDDGVEVLAGTDPTDELSFPATPTSQVPALGALGLWAAVALLLGAGLWLQRRLGQGG